MTRIALAALLLPLAACGLGQTDAAFKNPGCRAVMYEDATVRQRQREVTSPNAGAPSYQALEEAKTAAYEKCAGVGTAAPRGGVEKVAK